MASAAHSSNSVIVHLATILQAVPGVVVDEQSNNNDDKSENALDLGREVWWSTKVSIFLMT